MSAEDIYELYIAGRKSAVLAAALRVGLFDLLDLGPTTPDTIGNALELTPRGVIILCRALEALGLLVRRGDRLTLAPGNFFRSPIPGELDGIPLSQILHDWPPETGRRLLTRLFQALPVGGRIWVHEKLIGPDQPLANALVDLDLLVWTEEQQWDERGLCDLLGSVDFDDILRQRTGTYWSVVGARKAG